MEQINTSEIKKPEPKPKKALPMPDDDHCYGPPQNCSWKHASDNKGSTVYKSYLK